MCVLMDNLEWHEMLSNVEQSYLLERELGLYLDCKPFFEASDTARRGALDIRKIALYLLGRRTCFRDMKEGKVEARPQLYGTS